jgi:ABC-type multidrug transport system fused ATPase/permease subunit
LGSLRRLFPYLVRYRTPFWAGMFGLLAARIFDGLIPLLLIYAFDSIAAGRQDFLRPVLGIAVCAVGQDHADPVARALLRL